MENPWAGDAGMCRTVPGWNRGVPRVSWRTEGGLPGRAYCTAPGSVLCHAGRTAPRCAPGVRVALRRDAPYVLHRAVAHRAVPRCTYCAVLRVFLRAVVRRAVLYCTVLCHTYCAGLWYTMCHAVTAVRTPGGEGREGSI